jgi:two-component system chemotaxis response regulator CheB
MSVRDLIVVGGSFGALEPLEALLAELPETLPAAMLVTVHMPAEPPILLADRFAGPGRLRASQATDRAPIEHGHVYFAAPNRHLVVRDGHMQLQRTAHVNRHRPSIDVLFRTAARAYRERTIGVLLSGQLDDGASGLVTIESFGGVAVVQDPADALAPAMPRAALERLARPHCLPTRALPDLLKQLAGSNGNTPPLVAPMEELTPSWATSQIVCPHCGGTLRERSDNGEPVFACHVGHSFTMPSLMSAQSDAIDDALWAAMRALEEQAATSKRASGMAGSGDLQRRLVQRSDEALARARILRDLLERDPV